MFVGLGWTILLLCMALYAAAKIKTRFRKSRVKKAADEAELKVCIVGAGLGGIGVGLFLDDMGVDYDIYEKQPDLGGTWYDNKYPGVACDVMSHLYSFSAIQNPNWSKGFSGGAEILAYVNELAKPVRHRISFNSKVTGMEWGESKQKWKVVVNEGESKYYDIIITCTGLLNKPLTPKFTDDHLYEGIKVHTNQWKQDINWEDKRVAVIGTGASAVQAVPALAEYGVEQLTVYQRTAPWVPPRFNFSYSETRKKLFRYVPGLQQLYRWVLFWTYELRFFIMFMLANKSIPIIGSVHEFIQKFVHNTMRKHIKKVVSNPETAAKLTPSYPMGCKRITPSDTYLQAFNRENVHLETEKISRFTKDGIVTESGKTDSYDVIVYATGFDLLGSVNPYEVLGKDKTLLSEVHGDAPEAYLACTHYVCPNYFMLGGPGVVLGHNSIIFMGECQMTYIHSAIEYMLLNKVKSVKLKKSSHDNYQEWARKTMKNKVFEGDRFCKGWYRNSRGVNWTFWPTNLISFWWNTLSFDPENYDLVLAA